MRIGSSEDGKLLRGQSPRGIHELPLGGEVRTGRHSRFGRDSLARAARLRASQQAPYVAGQRGNTRTSLDGRAWGRCTGAAPASGESMTVSEDLER